MALTSEEIEIIEDRKKHPLPVGEHYYKVFHCHGCQTCWHFTEDGSTIIQNSHNLSQEDITEQVVELMKASQDLATLVVGLKTLLSLEDKNAQG